LAAASAGLTKPEEDGMRIGSVWLPIVLCLLMMAVCCGGPMLLGRWQGARGRPPQTPAVTDARMAASTDGGREERVDG
jgi:hypothetical protein